MLDSLLPQNVTLTVMKGLPAENSRVSALLREPSIMVDKTIRGRFVALSSGLSRRDALREQRQPIGDRIANAKVETRLEVFHPLYLRGRKFRLSEKHVQALFDGDPAALAAAIEQAKAFCTAEQDPRLKDLALSWFTVTLNGLT
jgi:hypothetical protein